MSKKKRGSLDKSFEENGEDSHLPRKFRRNKWVNLLGFVASLYLFIFSLELIKVSAASLGEGIFHFTREGFSEINALGFGWVATLITQSSGAAAATLIAFGLAGIIGPISLIYMMIGTRIGTSITALFTAFLVHARKRDFRHGFEIGLANFIYTIPIAILMFFIELFTGFFSKGGDYFSMFIFDIPLDFIDFIVMPLINLFESLPDNLEVVLGILVLVGSLKYLPRFMIGIWGEKNLKRKINRLLDHKWKSFLLGFGITAFLMSTSITITFLIPLVVARITVLRKVIPYMIGANLGGVSEIVIGGMVLGSEAFSAVFVYIAFSIVGLLWLFRIDWLFEATKFISKRTFDVSRKRALAFLIGFILAAIILSII